MNMQVLGHGSSPRDEIESFKPSIQRNAEILGELLSPEEISLVIQRLTLYDTAPFISYHGLKNCTADRLGGWDRSLPYTMSSIYRIYQGEGLLCADLRRERNAAELTQGRVTCSDSGSIDYRSTVVANIMWRKGSFPPVANDQFWGFPDYPSITFSLIRDREYYGMHPEKIPRFEHEKSVAEVPCSEFISLCLGNEEQVACFFDAARKDNQFVYHIPVFCGFNQIAIPDIEHKFGKDKCYQLMSRLDFEAWYDWVTES